MCSKRTCYILYINVINIILYNLCKRVGDLSFILYKNRVPFRQIYISIYIYIYAYIYLLSFINCSRYLFVFVVINSIVVDLRRYFRTARCCPRLWPAPCYSQSIHIVAYIGRLFARAVVFQHCHGATWSFLLTVPVRLSSSKVAGYVTWWRQYASHIYARAHTHTRTFKHVYVCDARTNITTVSHLHMPPQRYHPFPRGVHP